MGYQQEVLAESSLVDAWRLHTPTGVYLDGASGSFISTPDTNSLDIVGDIDIRAWVRPTGSWSVAATSDLVSKYGVAGNRSYVLQVTTAAKLQLITSTDGTTLVTSLSTAALTASANQALWVRATLVASTGTVAFSTSPDGDGIVWTALGSTVVGGATSVFNSTAPVELGGEVSGTVNRFTGTVLAAEVRSSVLGPVVCSPVFVGVAPTSATTFTDKQGLVWTLGGNANPVMPSRVWGTQLDGTSTATVSCPDSTGVSVLGDIDIRACLKPKQWVTGNMACVAKGATTTRSYYLSYSYSAASKLTLIIGNPDGVAANQKGFISSTGVSFAAGSVGYIRATCDIDNGASGMTAKFYTSTNGTDWVQLGGDVTVAGAIASIYDSANALTIGGAGVDAAQVESIYWAEVRNGIDGPVVARYDASKHQVVTSDTYQQRVLRTPGLVGYWPLGEPSGATATDYSGNGYNLTYNNNPTLGVPGPIVNDATTAVTFGNANSVSATRVATPAINGATSFTFECWILYNGFNTSSAIASNSPTSDATTAGWIISIGGAATITFRLRNAAGSATRLCTGTTALSASLYSWHHFCAVFDASLDRMTVYLNGVAETSESTASGYLPSASAVFALSALIGDLTKTWKGNLAQAAFYNTAIPIATIRDHYLAGRGQIPNGSGTVNDAYANTFTLNGAARLAPGPTEATCVGKPALNRQSLLSQASDTAITLTAASSQYLTVPYAAQHNAASMSFEIFVQPLTVSSTQWIASCISATTKGWGLKVSSAGVLTFEVGNVTAIVGPTLVAKGVYHIVVTSTGSVQTMYVNGVAYAAGAATYTPNTTSALYLGADSTPANYFNGAIDSPAIFSAVLTPARAHQHYLSGRGEGWGVTL